MIRETGRIYGRVRDISLRDLSSAFESLPYVQAALLFGSRSDGEKQRSHSQSDYDFAVLFDKSVAFDWGHLARLRVDLAPLLGLSDEDFDLVDLEIATSQMMASVANHYKILKGNVDEIRSLFAKYGSNG